MLEDLPASEVLPDSREFTYLNDILDQWLQLSGTVDTDIARYPVWRGVTDLVEIGRASCRERVSSPV